MIFNFVDIGTSDFRYTIPSNHERGIYVEPIDFYLDSIEDYPNTIKARVAITDKDGTIPIYFVPPEKIKKYDLPFFIRGCNKIGEIHEAVERECKKRDILVSSVIEAKEIDCMTLETFINLYNISHICKLKIDAEGFDCKIVKQMVELVREKVFLVDNVEFEINPMFTSPEEIENTRCELAKNNYFLLPRPEQDTTPSNKYDVRFYFGAYNE